MEYRASVVVTNDDPDPSPESIRHLVRHRLEDDGLVSVTVMACVGEVKDADIPESSPSAGDGHG